jgi:hypothetical protein
MTYLNPSETITQETHLIEKLKAGRKPYDRGNAFFTLNGRKHRRVVPAIARSVIARGLVELQPSDGSRIKIYVWKREATP